MTIAASIILSIQGLTLMIDHERRVKTEQNQASCHRCRVLMRWFGTGPETSASACEFHASQLRTMLAQLSAPGQGEVPVQRYPGRNKCVGACNSWVGGTLRPPGAPGKTP